MADYSVEHLESLLQQTLQPNTDVVRNAVSNLNKLLGNYRSIPPLVQLLQGHPLAEVRQLSAVLLRKRIAGHWGKLPVEFRESTKPVLLHIMGSDPSLPVRRSASHVVGVVARVTLAVGKWDELVPTLLQAGASPVLEHRDVALGLLSTLTESVGDYMRPYFSNVYSLLHNALQDPAPKIRMTALQTVGALVPWLSSEKEVLQFRELIPLMVEVIKYFVTNSQDEEAIASFEVFDELVETPIPVMKPAIPALVRFVLEIGAARHVGLSIRQSALAFIQTVVHSHARVVIKNKLIHPILAVVAPMCAEPDNNRSTNNNDDDLDDDDAQLTAHKFAAQLIDFLANTLPTKLVFTPALEYVKQFCGLDALHRRAAITILAVISEGCAELMKDNLDAVLPYVTTGFTDSDIIVREAACVAIGQFADNLQPDIISRHAIVLPNLFQGLSDPSGDVVMKCCYALEAYCENMEKEDIEKYLPLLMTRLVDVLGRANIETQEVAISAISAAAVAAGPGFEPYFGALYGMMQGALQLTDKSQLILRARATECIGLAIQAVGPSARQFVPEAMNLALAGLKEEFAELKEFTYGFFSNIAEAVTTDFAPYLPVVMEHIWASCDSSDGITTVPSADGSLLMGELEEDEQDDDVDVSVRTSFLDEKASAAHAIGVLASHTGAAFLPYVDRSLQSLNALVRYFHEDVRCATLLSIQCIATIINLCYPPPAPWEKGNLNIPLSPQIQQYVEMVMPLFLYSFMEDTVPEVAMQACDCIAEIAKTFGPVAINPHMQVIEESLLAVWQRGAPCQAHDFGDSEDEEEEESDQADESSGDEEEDHDLDLLDGASECCIEIAGALGQSFAPSFSSVVPHVLKHSKAANHHTFRALAYGSIAEMVRRMDVDLSLHPVIPTLVPAMYKGLADSAPDVQRTAAFLCGVLLQHTPQLINTGSLINISQILAALHPLFDSQRAAVVVDNACGAVARLITTSPQLVPLEHVLPVLLNALPLREDHEEETPVWTCLIQIAKSSPAFIAPHAGTFLVVVAKSLPSLPQQLMSELISSLNFLSEFLGAQFYNILSTLPPEIQQILQQIGVNKK